MKSKLPKQQQPVRKPGVEIGDHVYFEHADGPRSGRVAAHGKHGCTIDCDGEHHKIKWERVLGHKKRAQQRYSVIDEGEDGMIVQDAAGQRRFLSVPPDASEDQLVMKSFNSNGRIVLLVKSGESGTPFNGRPGLTKKQIVDRTGRKQTKWVRAQQEQQQNRKPAANDETAGDRPHASDTSNEAPSIKAGDKVNFKAGDFEGSGEVVGTPGADGAHVKDASGRIHQVRHDEMNHSGGQSDKDGAGDDAGKPQSADEIARALFDTSELEKLPAKAFQPVNSWEDLSAKAPEALAQFKSMLGDVAKTLGLETGKRPQSYDFAQEEENRKAEKEGRKPETLGQDDYMLPEHWDNDKGFLFMGPLKGEKRAREKVEADYDGDWSQVRDMVRATIAVPMVTQLPKVLRELEAAGMTLAQKPKNNLVKPLPGGYRDINLIVKMPNGILAELQLHVKPMTLAKEKGHGPYEVSRSIEAKYKQKGLERDKDQWDPKDREEHDKAMAEQESIYGDAWAKATNSESNLSKSMNSGIILLWKSKGLK